MKFCDTNATCNKANDKPHYAEKHPFRNRCKACGRQRGYTR
ncbi:MAG: hypothetical protein IJA97_05130 [Clostridia bacterium]|nr:hypothetical protein [Clostridia bacterium]